LGFTHHHPLKGDGVVRNKTVAFTDSSWNEVMFLYRYFLQPRKTWVVGFGCDSSKGMKVQAIYLHKFKRPRSQKLLTMKQKYFFY
jgi:hypothetical protein